MKIARAGSESKILKTAAYPEISFEERRGYLIGWTAMQKGVGPVVIEGFEHGENMPTVRPKTGGEPYEISIDKLVMPLTEDEFTEKNPQGHSGLVPEGTFPESRTAAKVKTAAEGGTAAKLKQIELALKIGAGQEDFNLINDALALLQEVNREIEAEKSVQEPEMAPEPELELACNTASKDPRNNTVKIAGFEKVAMPFDDFTIEPEPEGEGVVVYGHGTYGRESVLEGQPRRAYLDRFDTVEEALAQFPKASVLEHSTKTEFTMSDAPPRGFDPMDAGETWHEDDY
jgi:hypothetical protein